MRRLSIAVLAVLLVLTGAACDPQLSRKASGTFTGTTTWQYDTTGCDFVHQEFAGRWTRRQGAFGGTFSIEGCVAFSGTGEFQFTYEGTFVLVLQGGSELRGTVAGTTDGLCPAEYDHVLTVESGTRRYAGATGQIFLDGVWDCNTGPFQGPNPYTGTMTAVLESDLRTERGARLSL